MMVSECFYVDEGMNNCSSKYSSVLSGREKTKKSLANISS